MGAARTHPGRALRGARSRTGERRARGERGAPPPTAASRRNGRPRAVCPGWSPAPPSCDPTGGGPVDRLHGPGSWGASPKPSAAWVDRSGCPAIPLAGRSQSRSADRSAVGAAAAARSRRTPGCASPPGRPE
ncbi:MAG: hypothetical protein EPN98_14140 [Phenylobacterium sp.]|nr:MAG: hypothetical protein EPN98_14140 [Phenylobacterium sp.]